MKKVVFDVDGVLLSEERYYDVSALTVWEILYGRRYMALPSEREDFDAASVTDGQIAAIRHAVWDGDWLLSWLKQRGINSNWDMVHAWLMTCFWLLGEEYRRRTGGDRLRLSFLREEDFHKAGLLVMGLPLPTGRDILARWESIPSDRQGGALLEDMAAAMGDTFGGMPPWASLDSALWRLHTEVFQAWYLGDDLFIEQFHRLPWVGGKGGFLQSERPLAPAGDIKRLFRRLKGEGWHIAIATGRSRREVEVPFRSLRWYEEFDSHYVATESDVLEAEKQLGLTHLTKPHPFLYECALWGRNPEAYGAYARGEGKPGPEDRVYVVGDSRSDVLGAAAAGMACIGVLTGLDGGESEAMFTAAGVPFVERVTDIEDLLR